MPSQVKDALLVNKMNLLTAEDKPLASCTNPYIE
jgi:hypothetical protein